MREFRAGTLSLYYANGFLRYIKLGESEVLRMINFMVRDQNWNTIPQVVENEVIEHQSDSFRITYKCRARQDAVDFLWECQIEGTADSRLIFVINGKALKAFKGNRVGFTVLHPNKECRGKPVTIYHSDGATEDQQFPELISPHQPFYDIKAMKWKVGASEARLEFSGEVFETEDQRNWTDDSYKTYCTPLALPFPKNLEAGDAVSQKIELTVTGTGAVSVQPGNPQALSFKVSPEAYKLPRVGVSRSSQANHLTGDQLDLLKQVKFDHYQVDLLLSSEDWKFTLKEAEDEAKKLGLGLELSLFFKNATAEVDEFIDAATNLDRIPEIIHLFDYQSRFTSNRTVNRTVDRVKAAFPKTSIGAGTNAFFTELNRNRVDHPMLDHLVYSINPQAHAFDDLSLVENLYAQTDTVNTANSFSGGRAIRISPVTFKMRWNPNATESAAPHPNDAVDHRQATLFGAGWLLGSLQNLVSTKLASVTYFEAVGPKGIISETLYPMYFVFKYLLDRKEKTFRPIRCPDPLSLGGLVTGDRELVLVNFTNRDISVKLPVEWKNCRAYFMDVDNVWKLMNRQIQFDNLNLREIKGSVGLTAYALAFLSK